MGAPNATMAAAASHLQQCQVALAQGDPDKRSCIRCSNFASEKRDRYWVQRWTKG